VDVNNPKPENWKNFIPAEQRVLLSPSGGGYFFANYMKRLFSKTI
jgi:prolyl oligopeptidase